MAAGSIGVLSLLSGTAAGQSDQQGDFSTDSPGFQKAALLIGPESAQPTADELQAGGADYTREYYSYVYQATDTERLFYIDQDEPEWIALPPFAPSIETEEITVADGTTETELASYNVPNAQLRQTSVFKYNLMGAYSTASTNDDVTLRYYLDDMMIANVGSAGKNSNNAPWRTSLTLTLEQLNGTGEVSAHVISKWDNEDNDAHFSQTGIEFDAIDRIRATVQWNNAKADNSLTLGQGYVERWR